MLTTAQAMSEPFLDLITFENPSTFEVGGKIPKPAAMAGKSDH